MDLLEDGGRKFVEFGSGPPPEEEGADVAITLTVLWAKSLAQSALSLCPKPLLFHPWMESHIHWKDR